MYGLKTKEGNAPRNYLDNLRNCLKPRENEGTEREAQGVGRDRSCPRKLFLDEGKSVFQDVCVQSRLALRFLVKRENGGARGRLMNKFTVCFVMFYYVLIFRSFGNEIPTHCTFFIELFNEVVEFAAFLLCCCSCCLTRSSSHFLPFAPLPFWVPELTFALAFSEFVFFFSVAQRCRGFLGVIVIRLLIANIAVVVP